MAIILDSIADVEIEMAKLEHFGYGVVEAEQDVNEIGDSEAEDSAKADVARVGDKTGSGANRSRDQASSKEGKLPDRDAIAELTLSANGLPNYLACWRQHHPSPSRHRGLGRGDDARY